MRFTSGRLAGTRAARHVLLAAGSAALAAGIVAGSAGLATASVTGPATGSGHGHGAGSGQPSTAPAFFAGIISQSTSASPPSHGTKRHRHKFRHHASTPAFVDVVQTFSSANGAPAGTVTFPAGQDVESVARLGADQSFVASSIDRQACVSHLWTFTIDSAGKPSSLAQLSVPQVSGLVEGLTSSADGSTVAFNAAPCKAGHFTVGVLHLTTGTVHAHSHRAAGGMTRWDTADFAGSLSLTADGSVLGFTLDQHSDQLNSKSQAWTLRTSAPSGRLLRRAHQVPGLGGDADQAVLSPSGDQIWIEAGTSPATLTLATTSTGAQVGQGIKLSDFGRLALDKSGQHMLSYGGNPGAGHADVEQADLGSGQTSTQTITDPVIDGGLTTFAW